MGKWRENNPDKQAEIRKKSYEKNKDRLNMERRERYKTDPEYKSKKMECEIRYRSSGRRYEVSSTPSQRMKSRIRSRVRRQNPELRRRDNEHNAQYREMHKDNIRNRHKKRRQELVDSYVAHVMHISLRDIPPEIIETKRLIIKLRRELRSNNIKIRQL